MNITSIDFETANYADTSICAAGPVERQIIYRAPFTK